MVSNCQHRMFLTSNQSLQNHLYFSREQQHRFLLLNRSSQAQNSLRPFHLTHLVIWKATSCVNVLQFQTYDMCRWCQQFESQTVEGLLLETNKCQSLVTKPHLSPCSGYEQ